MLLVILFIHQSLGRITAIPKCGLLWTEHYIQLSWDSFGAAYCLAWCLKWMLNFNLNTPSHVYRCPHLTYWYLLWTPFTCGLTSFMDDVSHMPCEVSTYASTVIVSQWSSGNMPDCGVSGPRFQSHRRQLCLSRQPLRCTALNTGCTPLLQCLGRLSQVSLPPFVGR